MKPVSLEGGAGTPLTVMLAAERSHNKRETKTSWRFLNQSAESDCVSFSFSHSGDVGVKDDRKSGRFQGFNAGVPVVSSEFHG